MRPQIPQDPHPPPPNSFLPFRIQDHFWKKQFVVKKINFSPPKIVFAILGPQEYFFVDFVLYTVCHDSIQTDLITKVLF